MNRYNYLIILILALVFSAPGILAYFFYIHPKMLISTTVNQGVLLNPPVLLPLTENHETRETKRMSSKWSTDPKWSLVLWSPKDCEKNCLNLLDKLARIRLALGRHLYGVMTELLLEENAAPLSDEMLKRLREQDIKVIQLTPGMRDHLPILTEHLEIFIADKNNYLVLAYHPTTKSAAIFHDLKQLLR